MFGKMFFVSVILLQVFTFGLGRSLQWLFAPWIGKVGRRWLMGIPISLQMACWSACCWSWGI